MNDANRTKVFFLFIGDVAALYASLFLTLILRYDGDFYYQLMQYHALPFTLVFGLWIVVFYISGLYDLRRLRNNFEFLGTFAIVLLLNAVTAIIFFYLIPIFGITPKTNLFLVIGFFAVIENI